uniref:Histidine kinase n=1 Tax=Pectobacterium carotovorum TaxID=554 RepID=A0A0N7FVY9_PECCA|nr:hypothetical protein [Pectobacterium carotovorum]ALG88487.1 Hypothetical protein [Pectobacterium carotovorum]
MKMNTSKVIPITSLVFIVGFMLYSIYSIDKYHDEKAIVDGERYSKLQIIKTLENEKGIFYFLGDKENQIEVNKRYYELAVSAYKDSQDGK